MQYNNYDKNCFSAAELVVEFFLDASAPPLGLRATLNPLCAEPPSNLFVQGLFGVIDRLLTRNAFIYKVQHKALQTQIQYSLN